jgi:hypothetical protein
VCAAQVQYHSAGSLAEKHTTHPIYESWRTCHEPSSKRALMQQLHTHAELLPQPLGAAQLPTEPKRRPGAVVDEAGHVFFQTAVLHMAATLLQARARGMRARHRVLRLRRAGGRVHRSLDVAWHLQDLASA